MTGPELKAWAQKNGWTPKELADEFKISIPALYNWFSRAEVSRTVELAILGMTKPKRHESPTGQKALGRQ
jgi:hypothetical protein